MRVDSFDLEVGSYVYLGQEINMVHNLQPKSDSQRGCRLAQIYSITDVPKTSGRRTVFNSTILKQWRTDAQTDLPAEIKNRCELRVLPLLQIQAEKVLSPLHQLNVDLKKFRKSSSILFGWFYSCYQSTPGVGSRKIPNHFLITSSSANISSSKEVQPTEKTLCETFKASTQKTSSVSIYFSNQISKVPTQKAAACNPQKPVVNTPEI